MVEEEQFEEPVANRFEEVIQGLPGRILLPKRYRIDRLLSANAYTAIFHTFDEQKESVVNLRVFRVKVRSEDDYQYRRFKMEVKKLMNMNHPNISRVLDHGVLEEGLPFIVLENIEGVTLEEVLVHQNRLDAVQVGMVFSQIARGVQAAHDAGMLHETLKPSRIIIVETEDGGALVKIAGFSLLALYNKLGISMKTPRARCEFIGTSAYMSPEQCYEGADVDGRSDVYSIGCMMYEALSGQVPFLASNEETLKMHLETAPTPIPVLRKDLQEFPKRMLAVIDKCLIKDPTRRYQYVRDLQSDIEKDIDPEEREKRTVIPEAIQKAEQRVKESKESPLKLVATILGALLAAGALLFGGSYLLTVTGQLADNGIWQTKLDSAKRLVKDGKLSEANEAFQGALVEAKKFPPPDARMATTKTDLGCLYISTGKFTLALKELREAVDICSRLKQPDDEVSARALQWLSDAELHAGKNREAEAHARKAVETAESIKGEQTIRLCKAYLQLFKVLFAENKLEEAKGVTEKIKTAFGHTNVILPIEVLSAEKQAEALLSQANGRLDDAEKGFQEVLGSRQEKLGPGSLESIETMVLLGKLYFLQNKYVKSTKILITACDAKTKALGDTSPAVAELSFLIALVYDKSKNPTEAEKYYRQSLELAEKGWGKGSVETLPYVVALAKFLREHKQISAAQVYETEALEIQHPERVPGFVKKK